MSINSEINKMLVAENDELHAPFIPEFDFYYAVKNGDIEKVTRLCEEDFTQKSGLGKLSDDPVQSMKYHFTITAAMLARYSIDGGMELESAYSLSDLYIQKCDKLRTLREISELHREMVLLFTKRMKELSKSKVFSKQIVLCMNYIYENLHRRITLRELALYTDLSESYLSRLFKKETGQTITDYIILKKIASAKNMLKYTERSVSDIALSLAFSSQSYFTKIFRSIEGMTPKKYRDKFAFSTELGF